MNNGKLYSLSPSPHVKSKNTTQVVMRDVLIALMPALIWAVVSFGIMPLVLTLLSVALCVGFEAGYQFLAKKPITVSDLSAAVTGVILAFNVPSTCAWWVFIPGSFFAIVIVKQFFGGIGKNVFNPALAARIFMFVSWPSEMSGGYVTPFTDAVASATPLAQMKSGEAVTNVLDAFIGKDPGCLGEISALALLIGFAYLLVRKVITWHIPVTYIGTVALFALLFPQAGGRVDYMLMAIFSGGLMLGAIFMATDYTISPVTKLGRVIYGVGCGLLTVMIRYFGAYPEGVSFAIMIMNCLVWYIDRVTTPKVFGSKEAKS